MRSAKGANASFTSANALLLVPYGSLETVQIGQPLPTQLVYLADLLLEDLQVAAATKRLVAALKGRGHGQQSSRLSFVRVG